MNWQLSLTQQIWQLSLGFSIGLSIDFVINTLTSCITNTHRIPLAAGKSYVIAMQRDETRRDTNYVMKSSAAPPPTVGLPLSEHFNCSHCKLWPSQSSNQMSNESYDESVLNAFNYAASEGSPDSLSIHAHQSTWQLLHHASLICMACICNAARRRDRVSITQVGYLSMTTVMLRKCIGD